ncbi:hypothetical protein CWIS_09725 [Cellulomonas sp. A375-1]|uniref:hypothetical protein n=1 Tax=Cellulomonas sp. A375-1 TaxID=1672219 RepID=UPI0006527126|nr:hypothetical protein [Cellulomonas sp. A375-1]KMM45609.1 hypothetical protein CWIS_09725 [Cellulomonas sp. A375-1]
MTTIPLSAPYRMNKAALSVAADDFTAAVSSVALTPTNGQAWRGIGGNRVTPDPDWSLGVTAAQDLAPTGLMRYLLDHVGEEKEIVFTPVDDGPTITVTASIAPPGTVGGSATSQTVLEFSTSMECTGAPVFTDVEGGA